MKNPLQTFCDDILEAYDDYNVDNLRQIVDFLFVNVVKQLGEIK